MTEDAEKAANREPSAEFPLWQTVGMAFRIWAEQYADKEALVCGSERLSYRRLYANVQHYRAQLARAGVSRGQRVAIMAPSSPSWASVLLAVMDLGAVAVPINPRAKPLELRTILQHSEASVIVVSGRSRKSNIAQTFMNAAFGSGADPSSERKGMQQTLPSLKKVLALDRIDIPFAEELASAGESPSDARKAGFDGSIDSGTSANDAALIIYTSGTTGAPKGVVQSHGAIVKKAFDRAAWYRVSSEDRLLCSLPLYTQWGCNALLLSQLSHGVTVVLQEEFDAPEAMELIARERCTIFSGTPTHFRMLMDLEPSRHSANTRLRYANVSGDLISDEFYREVMRFFPGSRIISGYGMTESTGLITATLPMGPDAATFQTIGYPMPDVEVAVQDPQTNQEVADGVEGEIVTRGYHLMKEYFRDPEKTEAAIDPNRWLRTGDLGARQPDGSLVFCGRKKDMIRTGGFNVFANDIEDFLCRYPKVVEAAVVGLPDARLGEVVAAVVRIRRGESCSAEELREYCAKELSGYKVPRHFRVVTTPFPISETGKVQKIALKLLFEQSVS